MRGCDRNGKIHIGSVYACVYSEMQNKSQRGVINFAQQKLGQSVMGCKIERNKYSPIDCTRKMKGSAGYTKLARRVGSFREVCDSN